MTDTSAEVLNNRRLEPPDLSGRSGRQAAARYRIAPGLEIMPGEDGGTLFSLLPLMAMRLNAAGIGLAAPQVGREERLFVVDVTPMATEM